MLKRSGLILIAISILLLGSPGQNALFAWWKSSDPKEEINSLCADLLFERGSKAFENKKTREAALLLQASIRYNSHDPQAHYRLGIIYISQKEFEKAIENFKRAIKLKRDFTKAYVNLGSAYGKLKQYKPALSYLQKALSLENKDPVIYYNIGLIYSAMKKPDQAKKYFTKAEELGLPSQ